MLFGRSADCHSLSVTLLSVILPSVSLQFAILQNIILLSVILLSIAQLSVILVNVVTPKKSHSLFFSFPVVKHNPPHFLAIDPSFQNVPYSRFFLFFLEN